MTDDILSNGLIDMRLAPFPGTAMSSKKNAEFLPGGAPPPPLQSQPCFLFNLLWNRIGLKQWLHVPTLLYNICLSDIVRPFGTHVCSTFFVGQMFDKFSNIRSTKKVENTWVLYAINLNLPFAHNYNSLRL